MNTSDTQLYIGIMSGTSLDGVDAILCSFDPQFSILEKEFVAFDEVLKNKLKSLSMSAFFSVEDFAETERLITQSYADVVLKLLEKNHRPATEICAIGAHGQTLHHIPTQENKMGFSLQLLDGALLAVLTGIDVVSNLRQKDIALYGQGAPLVPAFHQYLFRDINKDICVVNIGGISNITVLTKDGDCIGYDLGPGNTLMDQWFQNYHNEPFDENGKWASQGIIHASLLKDLLHDPYFKLNPPKSTGLEYFNLNWLANYLKHYPDLEAKDVQATLLELTAIVITSACKSISNDFDVYLCGGGNNNHYLVTRINFHLPHNVKETSEIGVDGDFMEAAAFAWLAMRRIKHLSGNLPKVTGASRKTVLGALHLAE